MPIGSDPNNDDPLYELMHLLAGHAIGEGDELHAPFPYFGGKPGWDTVEWSRGSTTYSGSKTTDEECVWYSPACLHEQPGLFSSWRAE